MKSKTTPRNDIKKKLQVYSALATGVIALGNTANAQIHYVDVNPDKRITGSDSLFLDLDNNGVKDYKFVVLNSVSSGMAIKGAGAYPLNNNEILVDANDYAQALNLNSPINGNQTVWKATSSAFVLHVSIPQLAYNIGNWKDVSDKFLGIKFKINSNWHYGWIRMDVNMDTIIVKDYAYAENANGGLNAGSMVGITNAELESMNPKVFFNNGNINIGFSQEIKDAKTIAIFNSSGSLVYEGKHNENQIVIPAEFATGIYHINIVMGDAVINKKVVVK